MRPASTVDDTIFRSKQQIMGEYIWNPFIPNHEITWFVYISDVAVNNKTLHLRGKRQNCHSQVYLIWAHESCKCPYIWSYMICMRWHMIRIICLTLNITTNEKVIKIIISAAMTIIGIVILMKVVTMMIIVIIIMKIIVLTIWMVIIKKIYNKSNDDYQRKTLL